MSRETTTDLYEVTMALSYLREGMTQPATFDLFVRDLPPERGFLVAAGVEHVVDYLTDYRLGSEHIQDFASVLHRPPEDLEPLLGITFDGDVRAVPEGRVVLGGEPVLEVTAPLPVAQLVESYVLNQVSHQTALASKAARCVLAAEGHPVVDFSLRRTHGIEAADHAARAGAIAGFSATSNVAAAVELGLPAVGTMAHSYIEAFGPEEAAFRAFADAHPGPVTLLVDTYQTEQGVRTAAQLLRSLGNATGSAIRLDSGNLEEEARLARRILDAHGLPEVRIVVSGGLDEYAIDALVRAGAPVDIYAVGTRVGVSADAPYLDTAYKLVAYDTRPVMKLSTGKVTAPGPKQVFRRNGCEDVVALAEEAAPARSSPLLRPVVREGARIGPAPDLQHIRDRCVADIAALPGEARRITDPTPLHSSTSPRLRALTDRVRRHIRATYLPRTSP
ncbi:nicotinate phosphoribosyltransferase [Streptomyces spirodelae]|uniref:Nicotinate phosphoribosyltransferase n=1 Tax=Streptomyces spirodelae TaxID=2812904 RepID=A0ABS3X0I5_9ACTN|nr:nicotinate phosphoribosyltransferase [Streptomyces spirodelae]MBO8188899.1 nicotinate phosphoribosyltransferase [Streptomyces spirodelae]